MTKKIVIFVSDEGFGHKVRQSCVANELIQKGAEVIFQTGKLGFVKDLLDVNVKVKPIFNLLRLKKDQFGLNINRTSKFLKGYIRKSKRWIDRMVKSKHVIKADVLVTDIVEEVGVVAKRLNKPVFAISHFTWHWFFEKLGPEFKVISAYLKNCFEVDCFLYPPFSKQPETFPNPHPINIIARTPRPRHMVRNELGIQNNDRVILIGDGERNVWSGLLPNLSKLKKSKMVYITNRNNIGPPFIQIRNKSRFHDYINAADLVITKGGYSTLSECLAYGTKIMIVKERNHPETQENARLLRESNRAFVCNFEEFSRDPIELIFKALESKIDCTPLKNYGQKQACEILLNS